MSSVLSSLPPLGLFSSPQTLGAASVLDSCTYFCYLHKASVTLCPTPTPTPTHKLSALAFPLSLSRFPNTNTLCPAVR